MFSQMQLKVLSEDGTPVSQATVTYNQQTYTTDQEGAIKIPIAETEQTLTVEKEGFRLFSKKVKITPKYQNLNVLFVKSERETTIEEVVFQ